jgi:dihydrofolate reductase
MGKSRYNMAYQSIPISLIAAVSKNFVLGQDGKIPWHLTKDFLYFKAKTLNKPIIMGRKTFESIGRPLPRRKNIIITRQKDYQFIDANDDCYVCHHVDDALSAAFDYLMKTDAKDKEIMIIGGSDMYHHFLPLADFIYLTEIDLECVGDTFFPALPRDHWHLISSIPDSEIYMNHFIHFQYNLYQRHLVSANS